jgi:hypothetical protein
VQSLLYFLKGFTRFLINLVINVIPTLLIVFVVLFLPLWLIGRAIRTALRRRKNAVQPVEEKK